MALVLGSDLTGQQLAEKIAALAAGKQHRLAAYQVDGRHPVTPAAADGIIRYLAKCADRADQEGRGEDMPQTGAGRYFEGRAAGSPGYQRHLDAARESVSAVIADIAAGFYATPSRTETNDLDFWKVTEGRKPGVRFVKRVIGGGDTKYPRLVEISRAEQFHALGAILHSGIDKARADYADNEERCMKCGAQLTDDASRTARMGPVCRGDR